MVRGNFWKQVICYKYGEEEVGLRSCEVREKYRLGLWKAIRKEWDILGNNMAYSVGNGRSVRFWKDRWCGNNPLCISFPSLFVIASSKEAYGGCLEPFRKGSMGSLILLAAQWLGGGCLERFFRDCKEGWCVGMCMIRWFVQSQKMINLLSNLYMRL